MSRAKPKRTAKRSPAAADPPRAGRSAAATAARYAAFAEAYMTNGQNAADAAAAAGCTGKHLKNAGWKLLQRPEVQALLAVRGRQVAELAEMTTENWAGELRAVAYSRIDDLFGPDGRLLHVSKLPARVLGAISSVKVRTSSKDETVEFKFWNKPAALEIMARHRGLFERDNAQQQSDITVRVELVG
ncbi:MAG TPA: terminase small subunit [Acetobacteraceae bacterium]|jgi:phage terminase small subunit|nr:terminase small subunit [Acetobacteraceae bacterium]